MPCKKSSPTPKRTRRPFKHLSPARTRNLRRRALAGEKTADLAKAYGVHPTTVRSIRAGRTKRGL